jgi:hypothetical protein
LAKEVHRVNFKGHRDLEEFNDVDPALTALNKRNEGLIATKSRRHIALPQTRPPPRGLENLDEVLVVSAKDGFGHLPVALEGPAVHL